MNKPKLVRKISLLQATAINMTDMVGIGPFVVLSVVAESMNGPWYLYAWVAGGLLSVIDANVWSQLGATFPLAGGSYNFLKEGYGPRWGKLMSFLFVWQTMIQAPLVIASAAIGFAQYASFLVPYSTTVSKCISGSVVIAIVFLLYRKIDAIGKISVFLWTGVLFTMGWIISGGMLHGHFMQPILHINDGLTINHAFAATLGFASVKTIYSYLGYYNVCHLGGEIMHPKKNIPRSMFISIGGIAVLYLLMNVSIASVLPLHTIQHSQFVVSTFIEQIAGPSAANVATLLILWVAFASVFSATLGYSRIPYAAAADGAFFSVFAKLHPTKHFPYVSLLVLGGTAFVFSLLFKLRDVIDAILAMRILIQFIGQALGLILLVKRKGRKYFAWHMPLYPLPVLLAMAMWFYIFISTGYTMMLGGITVTLLGIIAYLLKAKRNKEWPFLKGLVVGEQNLDEPTDDGDE
ncbi:MAG: amino acid permease [Sphingobacteriales bacterium]|uniref:APC family permease n=1 Tax=Hydrotalea flava TaxID=714549 RepID=UPI000833ABEB|nr:amino acid permease [Hydrotalea flava]RTL49372.1 MAG: amino acid permease [Sphingobacteriales bacterium]